MAIGDKNYDIATDSSVQQINNTLANNVADKQTLTNVSNKIGNFTEGGSLETLVASLSQQVESLQTELAEVKSAVSNGGGISSADISTLLTGMNKLTGNLTTYYSTSFQNTTKTINGCGEIWIYNANGGYTASYSKIEVTIDGGATMKYNLYSSMYESEHPAANPLCEIRFKFNKSIVIKESNGYPSTVCATYIA